MFFCLAKFRSLEFCLLILLAIRFERIREAAEHDFIDVACLRHSTFATLKEHII